MMGERVRGPPCVALQSDGCKANPSRETQYTFVPEKYRVENELDLSACVCRSPICHRHVGLKPEAGKPGRPSKAATAAKRTRNSDSPTSQMDGPTRPALAGLRSKPAIVNEIFSIKAVRLTAVDCERVTSDEAVLEARRSDAPEGSTAEYEIHGEFKMAADSRAYPDTYWLTVQELWDGGLTKAYITESMQVFCDAIGGKVADAVHELSEDEEVGREEGEEETS